MAANQGPPYRGQGPDPVALEARCRAAVAAVAPELLDLNAYRVRIEDIPQPIITDPKSLAWRPDCYTKARSLAVESTPSRAHGFSPNDKEGTPPDPARRGPFPTCASKPTVFYEHIDAQTGTKVPVHLIAYAPGSQITANFCEAAARDCPLVVLFHAQHTLNDAAYYLKYEKLCRHIASYGFVVVSVQWRAATVVANYALDGLLLEHVLTWITSGHLGILKILSDQLILLGHSSGGNVVDRSATPKVINNSGFKLRAVVLMSPSGIKKTSNTYTNPPINALLVLHTVLDGDESANGGMSGPYNPIGTGVLAYEIAGHLAGGDINFANPQFLKHLAYVHSRGTSHPVNECSENQGTHYFQDETFALGYVAAFLLAYVRSQGAQKPFFRQQESIPGIINIGLNDGVRGIWHLHSEPNEMVLVNWGSALVLPIVQGADDHLTVALPDDFGLNHGQAHKITFTRGTECAVTINLASTKKLEEYELLSLSMCQGNLLSYENVGMSVCSWSINGSISLSSSKSQQVYSVQLTDIGGPLWYRGCLSRRRVCMEERVIALSEVAKHVNLDSIDRVVLRFDTPENLGQKAVIFLGNVKLLGKGP